MAGLTPPDCGAGFHACTPKLPFADSARDSYNSAFRIPETVAVPTTPVHTPTFEQFQALASGPPPASGAGVAIPVYRTLLADHLTPVTAYERLAKRSEHAFLLESVVGGERIARYSFLATSPGTIIKAYDRQVTIEQ